MSNRVVAADEGFALVAVLVFMLVVSAVVAPFALTARTRLMIASNQMEHERLTLLAEGLANVVSAELIQGLWPAAWKQNFEAVACRSGAFSFEVQVQNHAGLIDLNASDRRNLALGFMSVGLSPDISGSLADMVIRSRSPASIFGLVSSVQSETESNKHAPFESVSELQEFTLISAVPLADLYGIFTVNSKQGAVDLDDAPKALLEFLAHDKAIVSEGQHVSDAPAYTVNVVVKRQASGIAGQVGFVVEKIAAANTFRRVALYPQEEVSDAGDRIAIFSCAELFGSSVDQILEEWTL